MTFYFDILSIVDHLLNLFFPDTDDCFFNPFFRTVAVKFCRKCICDLYIQSLQNVVQHFFRCMAIVEHCCHRLNILDVFFQLAEHFLLNKRHHLYDKSTCASHGIVLFHQHTQTHRRRHLLRGCKIIGQIFCDLSCLQNRLSGIWFFESHILDHI